jgi:hypothetical protein
MSLYCLRFNRQVFLLIRLSLHKQYQLTLTITAAFRADIEVLCILCLPHIFGITL